MIGCEKCNAKFQLHHGDIWDGVWERVDLPNAKITGPSGSGASSC
jgi:hypothetical protein